MRPGPRFLLRHPAHFIALGFGTGLARSIPGTVGTVLALPIFWIVYPRVDALGYSLFVIALFGIGIWASDVTGRALGRSDYGGIVIDEIVAFLVVLFFTPLSGYWQAFAFLVFRIFDIWKPPPIRYYERLFKGGWGVMIDDLLAAFYTLIVLAAARFLLPG